MKKLYYENCHLKEFTAAVTDCEEKDGLWEITLDATAFYPEGGGQPWDLGALADANVLQVKERGEEIIHLCDKPLAVGERVSGAVDWQRRLDLMQQHTGEHILSGLIHKTFGYHNVGFHMGKQMVEIDFDGPISWEQAMDLEKQANQAVWDNLPVNCSVPSPEELEKAVYRSKRKLPWPVRIVEIPGIDSCACCGVHTKTTGEVGLIKIVSCAKFHDGVRLELVCGGRAYEYMAAIFEENRKISQLLSAKMPETFQAVQRLSDGLSEEKLRSAALQKQVFESTAKDYVNQENVVHFEDDLTGGQLRLLAEKISGVCKGFAAVFSSAGDGFDYCLAQPGGDLRQLGKDMNQALGGRGGGKPEFQQGHLGARREEILSFFGK